MRAGPVLLTLAAVCSSGCIAPSVLSREDRAVVFEADAAEWSPGTAADLPGTYVSIELSGPLAASLRKIVYFFEAGGAYTGAALVDDVPPHFEVISGRWRMDADRLHLDDGPPATLEVAEGGSLRLSGDEGRVVLRRERSE